MSITMKAIVGAIGAAALLVTLAARAQDNAAARRRRRRRKTSPISRASAKSWRCSRCATSSSGLPGMPANWPLADYEIGELSDGFDDVGKMLGGDIVKQHVGAPLDALQKAVDGKNSAAFAAAFDSSAPAAMPATTRSTTASS